MLYLNPNYQSLALCQPSPERLLRYEGKQVTHAPVSEVILVEEADQRFYLKRFCKPGKKWYYRFLSSKALREYRNLQYFKLMGFNVPDVVLFYEASSVSRKVAVLVTRAVSHAHTVLGFLGAESDWCMRYPILQQVMLALKKLHDDGFCHNDCRLRNFLTDGEKIYLFDCPSGKKLGWVPGVFKRRRIKDLALIYEDLKTQLDEAQWLQLLSDYDPALTQTVRAKIMNYYPN